MGSEYKENYLLDIIAALTDAKVNFIVCGGVAAVLHGVERMTVDLDISIDFSTSNVKRFSAVMESLRMQPRVPVPAESLADKGKVAQMVEEKGALVFTFLDPDKPYRQVDVALTQDQSFDILREHTETMTIAGRQVAVIGIEKLLELKKAVEPMREKDRHDIAVLEKLLYDGEKVNEI